ncbi:MAG: NlpC/P60 family protein [Pauljensenia sp.]|nr:NlpC/P60 family protein [Pauljensenia sp.]
MAKHDGDFGYTNDYRRKDPERYGWGDCSSTIAQAYRQCAGIDIGERSFDIARNGSAVQSCSSRRELDEDAMRPADVVCMGWHSGAFAGRISHVELYAGPGLTWGHGGPGRGPRLHSLSDPRLTGSANIIMVRRFIPDDAQAKEDDLTPDEHNMLSWLYENIKVPSQGFGYPQATQNSIAELKEVATNLTQAVESMTATVNRIATDLTVPGYGFGYPAASHAALEETINKLNDIQNTLAQKKGGDAK